MSWHGQKILTLEEVLEGVAKDIPAKQNPGEECNLWIRRDDDDPTSLEAIEGYIVGVKVRGRHQILYDLAVKIAHTDLYAVIPDIRGWVYPRDEAPDADGGLVPTELVEKAIESPQFRRAQLHVVKPDDEE